MASDALTELREQLICGGISRRQFLKRAAALGVSAAGAASLLSVGSSAHAAASPRRGGRLRLAVSSGGTTDSLDPVKYLSSSDYIRGFQIYSPLVALDRKSQPVPALAASWEPDASATEWTFNLRQGVTWTNGKDFTSADVIYSLKRHLAPDSESAVKPLLEQVTEMRADGKHTVRMKLASANADLPTLFTQPQFMITQEGEEAFTNAAGTGPFKISEYKHGIRMVSERNDDYWGGAANVDGIETHIVVDPTARINAMMAGEFDIAQDVDRKLLDLVGRTPGVELVTSHASQHANLSMMCDRPPTDNRDFRLALKYLIPRAQILKNVFKGYGMIGNDHQIAPNDPFYCHDIPQRAYDPELAKSHLKKAGMEGATIDLYTSEQATAGAEAIALLYKEAAKPAGLNVKVVVAPPGSYWDAVWMQKPLCISGWNPRPTADLMLTTANKSDGPWNETQWKNPRFDELLVKARGELDYEKRLAMYCEMQRMLNDDGGVGMIAYYDYIDAKRDNVMGFEPHPTGITRNAFFSTEVWLTG